MNILFYDRVRSRSPDGQSTHIYEILDGLAKMGHNVVTLNSGKATYSRWDQVKNGVSQSRVFRPFIGEITILWSFLYEIYLLILAVIIIVQYRGRFQVIYRRKSHFNSQYLLSKLLTIPSVIEVNGILADEIKITKRGDKFSLWIIDKLERFSLASADRYIVVTRQLYQLLCSEYKVNSDRVTVIQNGANVDVFKPMDIMKARNELNLEPDSYYICFVGSLVEWQGIQYAIRSLPLILKEYPNTHILIIGEGQMKQELTTLAEGTGVSNRVIFTGIVPYAKVPLYINASDICIVPKTGLKSGYSPLKLYEYMSCGKPVVGSRASGLEVVEESKSGILIKSANHRELATAILRLLKDKELRRKMGDNGRRYVLHNGSWESVAKRVTEVFSEVASSGSSKGR